MRVTIDDLKRFALFQSFPDKLQKLSEGQFYVFYYKPVDEENKLYGSVFKVYADDVVQNINISLYRELNSMMAKSANPMDSATTVGYFAFDSFESRCGIFYLFLNTYCDKAAVEAFYEWCVENDKANDYAVSTSAMNDIYNRNTFIAVITFFATESRHASVMRVYDMVDNYLTNKTGQSLYGGYIKRIVQLIPYEGGVLPEKNGDLRFMVIGEKAVLSDTEAIKLEQAKAMLRSLIDPVEIYKSTGWYFNLADGKWRHNTTDVGAYIASDHLMKVEGALVYSPPASPIGLAQINLLFKQPEKIYETGYAGKMGDVLKHPSLYSRYPVLANLPLLFRDTPKVPFGTFYQSPNSLGGYMMIDGNGTNINLVSVMLHETQHSIQRIEGFGTGGNEMLAAFVMSIGGNNVRRVFYSIKGLQKTLLNKIMNEDALFKLQGIVSRLFSGNAETKRLKEMLMDYVLDMDKFRNNLDMFSLYTTFYLTAAKQLVSGEFIEYLYALTDGNIYELTELLNEGIENADVVGQKLLDTGYRDEDVRKIFFNAYEDLLGETESRSVQHQMMLEGKYSNYFYLYQWENAPARKIAVINDEYIEVDSKTLAGAVETIKDGYILHFKKSISVEPFLHELGHIVDDLLCQNSDNTDLIAAEYAKTMTKKNRSEFFVDCFLGYVRDVITDAYIQKDLAMNFDLKRNAVIDEMLSVIFDTTEVSGGRLKYMVELNKEAGEKFEKGGEIELTPAWKELGIKVFDNRGWIYIVNSDEVSKGEYVKVVAGKIIAKNPMFNEHPIIYWYNEVLPDGIYFGKIYKKNWDERNFTYFTYNGKRCKLEHMWEFDYNKHKKGDCRILCEGETRGRNVRAEELSYPKQVYVFAKEYEMKEDNSFIPNFNELTVYKNYTESGDGLYFNVGHNLNNEELDNVRVDGRKFAERHFLFSNSPATPEFKAWIFEKTESDIVPILSNSSNWKENQEYDRYEGYQLKSISLHRQSYSGNPSVLDKLNEAIRKMFNDFTGKKYEIEKFEKGGEVLSALPKIYTVIAGYHNAGAKKIDIGSHGRDFKYNLSNDDEVVLLNQLKSEGFKIKPRTNSQGLVLAWELSWGDKTTPIADYKPQSYKELKGEWWKEYGYDKDYSLFKKGGEVHALIIGEEELQKLYTRHSSGCELDVFTHDGDKDYVKFKSKKPSLNQVKSQVNEYLSAHKAPDSIWLSIDESLRLEDGKDIERIMIWKNNEKV